MKELLHGVGRRLLPVALSSLAALTLEAQVPRDDDPPVPPEIVPPGIDAPLSESEIERFAAAYIAVEDIHTEAREALASADDPRRAYEVKSRAEGRIIEAVEASGLKLEEFNRIAERMAHDRKLEREITEKVRERRGR